MSRALSRKLWPFGVVLLILLAWDRAAWLHLAPRDDARVAQFTSFPLYEEADRNGGEQAERKAVSLRNDQAKDRIESRPWYMLLYVFGRFEPWLILAAWLVFSRIGVDETGAKTRDELRRGLRQAGVLVASILVSGVGADLLKLVVRRVRPEFADGWFVYIPMWESTPANVSFGMPSSHAAVAFAAAIAVGRMVPSTRWVLYPMAVGCALSRVLVGAHFLSDVYVGALIGIAGERLVHALGSSSGSGARVPGSG